MREPRGNRWVLVLVLSEVSFRSEGRWYADDRTFLSCGKFLCGAEGGRLPMTARSRRAGNLFLVQPGRKADDRMLTTWGSFLFCVKARGENDNRTFSPCGRLLSVRASGGKRIIARSRCAWGFFPVREPGGANDCTFVSCGWYFLNEGAGGKPMIAWRSLCMDVLFSVRKPSEKPMIKVRVVGRFLSGAGDEGRK